jgi:Mn2+/Fe2+ NRAMP family transporter
LVTGAYFLLSAAAQVRYVLSVLGSGTPFEVAFILVGFSLCLVLGVAGVYISHMFRRYEATWDRRLQESAEAERRLGELLEGSS